MQQNIPDQEAFFIPFQTDISGYALPERFTFPFHYQAHPLSVLAAQEIQHYIETQTDWDHNFGMIDGQEGLVFGKMFGVLVVQNKRQELGYLAAFSGKLGGKNHHPRFVPPVFDILEEDGFFRKGEAVVSKINSKIDALEQDPELFDLLRMLDTETALANAQLAAEKQEVKSSKQDRKRRRDEATLTYSQADLEPFLELLIQESLESQYRLKDLTKYWNHRLGQTQSKIAVFIGEIADLKASRKKKSAALQKKIMAHYYFLNQAGDKKSVGEIFDHTADVKPPAGAGDCAAPKLLQYAFLNELKPIAMAEFWWGASPKAEIRKHGYFYPACRNKCEPILKHMLEGIAMDDNPMLFSTALGYAIETVYEDDHLLVINKPADLLSVPGRNVEDSVYYRMKQQFPEATGPLIVHRLDMSTSGLMLIAKTKEVHKNLQSQFLNRHVKKRYIALIDGILDSDQGVIDLPIRVDLDDRPRQLVCYEYGKKAITEWTVVSRQDGKTKIHFYPITGRTHQLRVHAAHPLGLNMPITGDDLYGTPANRLHLHAERIEFIHPDTKKVMVVEVRAGF